MMIFLCAARNLLEADGQSLCAGLELGARACLS